MNTHAASCLPPGEQRPRTIREQFRNPTGPFGWVAGHVMAVKNGSRSRWVLSLLRLESASDVLEVGFGPGMDVRRVALLAPRARVTGIDRSEEMLRQARRRNAAGIASGRVSLHAGPADALPFGDASFDRAFAINVVQFWPERLRCLHELLRVVRPGGVVAIAIQPRNKGATAAASAEWRERLGTDLAAAGFTAVRTLLSEHRPVPVACALGERAV
jgi:ubiquinone/menaquinone biosynthesis C-methylase UbiE